MKKALMVAFVAILGLMAMGCGSDLHNTPASYVTLEMVNWPDGDYDWRGAFGENAWNDQNKRAFTVTNGSGKFDTTPSLIIDGSFTFTIVTKEGAWARPWLTKTEGNEKDFGVFQNFLVPVPMDGATHVVKIDGSSSPAKLFVDGVEVSNEQKDLK